MTTLATQFVPRIEAFLPQFNIRAKYEVRIAAPRAVVYSSLLHMDFNDVWLVRLLMSLRSGKVLRHNRAPKDLRERLPGTGFVVLAEVTEEELVIGVAGRFWRPDGGRYMELTAGNFLEFATNGMAKVAWNFTLDEDSPASTVLATETRIQCFGAAASWKFGVYWTLVGPFSGLIRKAMLGQIKKKAEASR